MNAIIVRSLHRREKSLSFRVDRSSLRIEAA